MKYIRDYFLKLRKIAATSNSRFLIVLVTMLDYLLYFSRLKNDELNSLSLKEQGILYDLRENGFSVVENYLSPQECEALRSDIDRLIMDNPQAIHSLNDDDERVFGAENLSVRIESFSSSKSLNALADNYSGSHQDIAFTLAARMKAKPGNLGSGGGWHRDAFYSQFKAILYISDVSLENGPFQLIAKSHRLRNIIRDIFKCKLSYMQNRFEEGEVDCITSKERGELLTFNAKAGTLLLVDTSAIHRGMPIQSGIRYALTNYYFPPSRINDDMYKTFHVFSKMS